MKRSLLSALAAIVAALVPSLVVLPAKAASPSGSATPSDTQGKAGKPEGKRAKKTHAAKGQKAGSKPEAKAQEATRKPDEAQADAKAKASQGSAATPKGKKTKKTASRGVSARAKKAKKADAEAPQKPCFGPSVTVDRGGLEGSVFPLLDCHGAPLPESRAELSLLARPWSVARPGHYRKANADPRATATTTTTATGKLAKRGGKGKAKRAADANEIAPGVRLLDPGLLTRLDAVSRKFASKPISLVSGYRPQSRGSQHQSGRALDLRVAGVSNEELSAFCKTLTDTGCGYYPNSSFVHIDVRNPGTGGVSWIDASGPGEAPRYVKQWPPPDELLPVPAPAPAPTHGAATDAEPHDSTADPWQLDLDSSDADEDPDSATEGSDAPAAKTPSPPLS